MTEATPMMIPRAVKKVRILFATRLRMAILNKSQISIGPVSPWEWELFFDPKPARHLSFL